MPLFAAPLPDSEPRSGAATPDCVDDLTDCVAHEVRALDVDMLPAGGVGHMPHPKLCKTVMRGEELGSARKRGRQVQLVRGEQDHRNLRRVGGAATMVSTASSTSSASPPVGEVRTEAIRLPYSSDVRVSLR